MTPVCYSFRLRARAALAWTKKKRSLRNGKLKANRASLKTEERKAEDMTRKQENRKPQEKCLATLKRLKRGDDNELERNLRLHGEGDH